MPMPTVRSRCPSCRQEITFTIGQCALLPGPSGRPVAYGYNCPACGDTIVRSADPQAISMLIAGGASVRGVPEQNAPPLHPESPRPGPPLTADDLIDFHLLLSGPSWFDRLAGTAGASEPEASI